MVYRRSRGTDVESAGSTSDLKKSRLEDIKEVPALDRVLPLGCGDEIRDAEIRVLG